MAQDVKLIGPSIIYHHHYEPVYSACVKQFVRFKLALTVNISNRKPALKTELKEVSIQEGWAVAPSLSLPIFCHRL